MEEAVKRRQFIAASAAALCLPSVVRAEKSSVLKFVPYGDLSTLDPIWTQYSVTRCHGLMVFDTLYGQTGAGQGFAVKPQMVAGHTVEDDGLTWKLTLREGLTFHDGAKVLARDCVASIKRWGVRDAFGQTLMQRTNDLSALDDRTILFRLNKPFALLPDALGKYAANICPIMPERLAATDPYKQITEVVGSGPFRFKTDERVQGSMFVYERFDGYRPREDGEPDCMAGPKIVHFDRVEWHILPDQGTGVAALRTGEIDWQEYPVNDLVPTLRRNERITVHRATPLGWHWGLRPNPAIRRALTGGIDQTECMTAAMGPEPAGWHVPTGFFPIGSSMASDVGMAALTGPCDLGKIRKDLEAAGYRGEKIVVILPAEGWAHKAIIDVVVDMLRKVGMNVDYQVSDYSAYMQRIASMKAPGQGGWSIRVTAAPGVDWLTPATHVLLRGNGEKGAPGWPTSSKLEALREQWLDAPDVTTQKAICGEIQTQAFVDVPYLPLGTTYPSTAYRSDLTGVMDGQPLFWNVCRQG
jgi:peptide/nickel transport system substrate-binding protein